MKIAGFVKNSFVDYPEKISAVVFTHGCNFNCWYCHNKHIIGNEVPQMYDEKIIFDFLNKRKNMLDAVVITGGEPTLQVDLKEFIIKVKKLGYLVKLDTNGSNPEILNDLIQNKLVDYVAMDIKTCFEDYEKLCQTKVDLNNIKKSIEILKNNQVDYEFRTTLSPEINEEEFDKILQIINGCKNFYIQKCNIPQGYVISFNHNRTKVEKLLKKSKSFIKNSGLRGFD